MQVAIKRSVSDVRKKVAAGTVLMLASPTYQDTSSSPPSHSMCAPPDSDDDSSDEEDAPPVAPMATKRPKSPASETESEGGDSPAAPKARAVDSRPAQSKPRVGE